jgi:hypothetical protein
LKLGTSTELKVISSSFFLLLVFFITSLLGVFVFFIYEFFFCVITMLYSHIVYCKIFFPRYQHWHNLCSSTSLRSHALLHSLHGLTNNTKFTHLICKVFMVQQTVSSAFLLMHLLRRLAINNPFLLMHILIQLIVH